MQLQAQVDELVEAQKSPVAISKSPKRNSKDDMIQKIIKLSEDCGEDL